MTMTVRDDDGAPADRGTAQAECTHLKPDGWMDGACTHVAGALALDVAPKLLLNLSAQTDKEITTGFV